MSHDARTECRILNVRIMTLNRFVRSASQSSFLMRLCRLSIGQSSISVWPATENVVSPAAALRAFLRDGAAALHDDPSTLQPDMHPYAVDAVGKHRLLQHQAGCNSL